MKNSVLAIIFYCFALSNSGFADEKPALIYWDSVEGEALRSRIPADADYWALIPSFAVQNTQTFCAVASAVTVLNALPIKKPIDPLYAPFAYFTQTNFFSPAVTKVISQQTVLSAGMTREQLAQALEQQGTKVENIAGDSLIDETLRSLFSKHSLWLGSWIYSRFGFFEM